MFEIVLRSVGGSEPEDFPFEGDRLSFGRGSDADLRFDDTGLSRLHATVYRDGDNVWIVDENSSNGTFVNGEPASQSGTPLSDGDEIKIGHTTLLKVSFVEPKPEPAAAPEPATEVSSTGSAEEEKNSMLVPGLIVAVAVLLIGVSAVLIGLTVMGGSRSTAGVTNTPDPDVTTDLFPDDTDSPDPEDPGNSATDPNPPPGGTNGGGDFPSGDPPTTRSPDAIPNVPAGKSYQQMSEAEKNEYVKAKAEIVSRVIGNSSSESIPPGAVAKIRYWLDGYVRRIRATRNNDCSGKGWLSSDMTSILERARSNAPFIIRAFNERGIDPQVGLYLAMIESEHCPCLQSYTGPLGMFQFTQATGKRHGLNTRPGASPSNPDERCEKEPAARAAASYMKSLTGRIGTGPLSIPLAIASYNSGEGGLGKNLRTALEANESQDRSFWTLVANAEMLAEQFQRENIKYVPKFFAAAIIGENPRDFGIDMKPLSLYTK